MSDSDLIADGRKWVQLHKANHYQKEAARRMAILLNELEDAHEVITDLKADLAECHKATQPGSDVTRGGD